MVLSASEQRHLFDTPNGGTVTVISSLNTAVVIGENGRDGQPTSPEETQLAKECSKELAKANEELNAELQKLKDIPSDGPATLDSQESSWDSSEMESGPDDDSDPPRTNGVMASMTKDGKDSEYQESYSDESGAVHEPNDMVTAYPNVMATGSPPLNQA